MVNIAVIIPESPLASSITGFLDVLTIANQFLTHEGIEKNQHFSWQLLSIDGDKKTSSQGVTFSTNPVSSSVDTFDCVYFAAQHYQSDKHLLATLEQYRYVPIINDLCLQAKHVCAQCTAVSFLASTGQLNDQSVTTSWWLNCFMQEHFPIVDIQINKLLYQSGKFITSAATNSSLLLALTFIENIINYEFAARVARCMTVDYQQNSQGRFMHSSEMFSRPDRVVDKAKKLVNQPNNPVFTVKILAEACNVTERTLNRRFKQAVGLSPKQYVNLVRIEEACRLLTYTDLSIFEISAQLQFTDESALRKAFIKQQGQSMHHYRQFSYKQHKIQ